MAEKGFISPYRGAGLRGKKRLMTLSRDLLSRDFGLKVKVFLYPRPTSRLR
jgi:hypothetical protein